MITIDLNETHVRASKHWKTGAIVFHAFKSGRHGETCAGPLAYTDDEAREPQAYATFEAAEAICVKYEYGLPDDVREATWDYLAGDWEIHETFASERARSTPREDFHADI